MVKKQQTKKKTKQLAEYKLKIAIKINHLTEHLFLPHYHRISCV